MRIYAREPKARQHNHKMSKKADIQQPLAVQMTEPQPVNLQQQILVLHGKQVLLDFQLAKLYGVETRVLKQAVRRNIERFPEDFMFSLTEDECNLLISNGGSQFVIPSGYNFGGTTPFAFTEQGVSMLSSILRSKVAIQINIAIMRAFVAARQLFLQNHEHETAINELKQRMKMLEDILGNNLGAVNDLSDRMKKELENIYRVLGALSARSQKPLNPTGYEAIDAQRKAKDEKKTNNNN